MDGIWRAGRRRENGEGREKEEEEEEEEMDGLLLANPMAQDESPRTHHSTTSAITPQRPSSAGEREPDGSRQHAGLQLVSGPLKSGQRFSSYKGRPKSPSVRRFLARGAGGGGRTRGKRSKVDVADEDEEEEEGSSCSDEEEQYSPRSPAHTCSDRHSEPPSPCSSSSSHLQQRVQRGDSGFSSEKDVLTSPMDHIYEDVTMATSTDTPATVTDTPAGIQALEVLHSQLQILVRSDGLDAEGSDVHLEVIEGLRRQVEGLQDEICRRTKGEDALKLEVAMAEHQAASYHCRLLQSVERNKQLEQCYSSLHVRHLQLQSRFRELERLQQRQSVFNEMDRAVQAASLYKKGSSHTIHRVQSSREFDRPIPPQHPAWYDSATSHTHDIEWDRPTLTHVGNSSSTIAAGGGWAYVGGRAGKLHVQPAVPVQQAPHLQAPGPAWVQHSSATCLTSNASLSHTETSV